jgi:hypothetical protein
VGFDAPEHPKQHDVGTASRAAAAVGSATERERRHGVREFLRVRTGHILQLASHEEPHRVLTPVTPV